MAKAFPKEEEVDREEEEEEEGQEGQSTETDCYRLLGVASSATKKEIRKAYHERMLRYHPDKGGDEELSKKLITAFRILSDDLLRTEYDSERSGCDDEGSDQAKELAPQIVFGRERLSEAFRRDVEEWKVEFGSSAGPNSDNYFTFYGQVLSENLTMDQAEQEQGGGKEVTDVEFYCRLCEKCYVSDEHHYDQALDPYVSLFSVHSGVTQININDRLVKCWNRHSSFWIPTRFVNDLGMWDSKNWKDSSRIRSEADKYVDILRAVNFQDYRVDLDAMSKFQSTCLKENEFSKGRLPDLAAASEKTLNKLVESERNVLKRKFGVESFQLKEPTPLLISPHCKTCNSDFGFFKKRLNCAFCGESQCSSCTSKMLILSMGLNAPVLVCKPCVEKVNTEDTRMWIQHARNALEADICKHYLYMSLLYSTLYKISLRNVWMDVAEVCFEKGGYDLVIQVCTYGDLSDELWKSWALRFCKKSEFDYAMTCLSYVKSQAKSLWIEYGRSFSKYNKALSMYCYKVVPQSFQQWIEEAKFYSSKADSTEKIAYPCLLEAYKTKPTYEDCKLHTQRLFEESYYKIALCSCKLGALKFETMLELAERFTTQKLCSNHKAVVILMLHLKHFESGSLQTVIAMYPILRCIRSAIFAEPLSGLEPLIKDLLQAKNVEGLIMASGFMTRFWRVQDWAKLGRDAVDRGETDLAILYNKLLTVYDNSKDPWLQLGFEMREKGKKVTAHLCFLAGCCDVGYLAEYFFGKNDHEAAIEYYLAAKKLKTIRRKAKELFDEKSDSNFLYYSAIVDNISRDPNTANRVQQLYDIVLELIVDPAELTEMLKLIVSCYPRNFVGVESLKMHEYMIDKISKDQPTFRRAFLILGAFHFFSRVENNVYNEVYLTNLFSDIISMELTRSVYNDDFEALANCLLNLSKRSVKVAEQFLKDQLASKKMEMLPARYKAMMKIISGTIKKVHGSWLDGLKEYEGALIGDSTALSAVSDSLSKLMQDFQFHKALIKHVHNDVENLHSALDKRKYVKFEEYSLLSGAATPRDLSRFKDCLRNSEYLRVIRRCEQAISKQVTDQPAEAAFCYIDLVMASTGATRMIGSLLMAISCFVKAIDKAEDGASSYAYRNVIFSLANQIFFLCRRFATPFLEGYLNRVLFSTLMSANQKLSQTFGKTSGKNTAKTSSKTVELIPKSHQPFVTELLKNISSHLRVNPFAFISIQGCLDTLYLNIVGITFLKDFMAEKLSKMYHISALPVHLYYYYRFDGIWRGWIDDDDPNFYTVKEEAMQSLLDDRGWSMKEVQNQMEWPLLRRNPGGWLDETCLELQFTEEAYNLFSGIEFDLKKGKMKFLLSKDKTTFGKKSNLFTAQDISEVFRNRIKYAMFTLDQPNPRMPSHPFQEAKYSPRSLYKTDYLNSLIHADILLKEFTTGVEVSSRIPFRTHKTEDGLLKRLPPELQAVLKSLADRDKAAELEESVHRFWIETSGVVWDLKEKNDLLTIKIYDVTCRVKKHLLSYDEQGNTIDDKENDKDDSAEAIFAKEFTANYDKIGKYFPLLLRLKELTKISALYNAVETMVYPCLKKQIEELELRASTAKIESILRDLKKSVPTYPLNTDSMVEEELDNCLKQQGIRKSHVSDEELDKARRKTREQLAKIDREIVDSLVNRLSKAYFVSKSDIRDTVKRWLSRGDYAPLVSALSSGLRRRKIDPRREVCEGLDCMGLRTDTKEEESNKLGSNGECTWFPAAFCTKTVESGKESAVPNKRRIYGGVCLLPTLIKPEKVTIAEYIGRAFKFYQRLPSETITEASRTVDSLAGRRIREAMLSLGPAAKRDPYSGFLILPTNENEGHSSTCVELISHSSQTIGNERVVVRRGTSSPINFLSHNVNQSVVNKLGELLKQKDNKQYRIILLQETSISSKIPAEQLEIPGYVLYRKDRSMGKGGGVMMYVHESLNPIKVAISNATVSQFFPEFVCGLIETGGKPIFLATCYRPPNYRVINDEAMYELMNEFSKKAKHYDADLMITGDFNRPLNADNARVKFIFSMMVDFGLSQMVREPTRGENWLDLLMVSNPDMILNLATSKGMGKSDHRQVHGQIKRP